MSENYGLKTDACYKSIAQLNCAIERENCAIQRKKKPKILNPIKGETIHNSFTISQLSGNYSVTYCNQVQYDTAYSTARFRTSSIFVLGLFKACKSSDYPDNLQMPI